MDGKQRTRFIVGLVMIALGAFLLTSLFTHDPTEGPFADFLAGETDGNACGPAGAWVSAHMLVLLGWTAHALAAAVTLGGVLVALRPRMSGWGMRGIGLALLVATGIVVLAILNASAESTASVYQAGGGRAGGMLGVLLTTALYRGVGSSGTLILCGLSCAIGAFLLAGAELTAFVNWLLRATGGAAQAVLRILSFARRAGPRAAREPKKVPAERAPKPPVRVASRPDEDAFGVPAAAPEPADSKESADSLESADPDEGEEETQFAEELIPEPAVITRHTRTPPDIEEEEEALEFFNGPEGGEGMAPEFRIPPVGLLDELESGSGGDDESEIREKGRILARTLGEFRVEARVVTVMRGPVITMYELALAPGTKVSKVESLADDLAIALKAPNVRIVAPLPGRNTVGIEVPNTEREVVGVRELMAEVGKKAQNHAIPLFLGKDTAGTPLVLDLARCPHLLVAGATGAGKSVAMNAMILSILMTRTPAEVQLLLIDPKSVEFSLYARLPHLMCPVLSDMKKAASVLKWACKKMDERYSILAAVGVRDLKSYNALGKEEILRRLDPDEDAVIDDVPFYMSHIVIIVDEFGELMMVAAKEVEKSVIRLSQKARAVGIHLICATQRPSIDVITGLIKSNLPARIAFQVASMVDSRTILDRNGAERLLGRGDMLLLPPGSSRLVRAQGSFVSEEEIERVVEFLEAQGGPQFKAEIRDYHAAEGVSGEFEDDLYDEAVRVVVETQRGSVSLLQRRLAIGYSRAARLVDMMADAGIVGPHTGSQARRVLMTLEQWEAAHSAS
ncbi:MAG: DNA translocase FtsK [Candidatus Brocadiaceae bacterium]|nr:DNA translocase FtsK [Candidatus Brocadiaceae bacterium]